MARAIMNFNTSDEAILWISNNNKGVFKQIKVALTAMSLKDTYLESVVDYERKTIVIFKDEKYNSEIGTIRSLHGIITIETRSEIVTIREN